MTSYHLDCLDSLLFPNYQDNDIHSSQRTDSLGQSQLLGYAVFDRLGHPNHLKQLKWF